MVRRLTSPTFVGREEELTSLRELARPDTPAVALVSGEAGVGKTRLVAELASHAPKSTFLVGGCVQFGEQVLPLAPAITILRGLPQLMDDQTLDRVLGPARTELSRLAPGLGVAPPAGEPPASARLFELFLGVLDRLAQESHVVVVFEDLHWADATSRDLFGFLARQLRAPVLLVGTYRSDELHRRHPLRPLLAELRRSVHPDTIALAPLDQTEMLALLAEVLRDTPDATLAEDVYRRSEGNPFFAEELIATGSTSGEVPETLRDVILARAASLDEEAFRLLRVAAAAGGVDDTSMISDVANLPADSVDGVLAQLVADGFLVAEKDRWRFRHELAREVFEDELLPGERPRVHSALAKALLARAPERAGPISRHLWLAGNQPGALEWSVRAAKAAEQVGAWAEAEEGYERALDVWDQVPEASDRAGVSHPSLLLATAEAASMAQRFDRAIELTDRAIDEVADDPVAAGSAWVELASYRWVGTKPGAREAMERALDLIPAEPPSPERAYALARYGGLLNVTGLARSDEDPAAISQQAVEQARATGNVRAELYAMGTIATRRALDGDPAAVDLLRETLRRSIEAGSVDNIGRSFVNLTYVLFVYGRHDEVLAVVEEAEKVVADLGAWGAVGVLLDVNRIDAMRCLGRWDDVEAEFAKLRTAVGDEGTRHLTVAPWAYVWLRRGRVADARELFDRAAEAVTLGVYVASLRFATVGQVELAVHDRSWDTARDLVDQALPALLTEIPPNAAEVVASGLFAEAERAADRGSGADPERAAVTERWLDQIRDLASRFADSAFSAELTAWLAQAEAERARLVGEPAASRWQALASAWEQQSRPYETAYAQWRAGEALLFEGTSDRRTRAAELLTRAHETAHQLGAVRIIEGIEALARQARLTLGEHDVPPTSPEPATEQPFGLTDRELQVLQLVAQGRSNGEIGAELFVSTKTASVHVSNILRKLDAANRVEAAAMAYRAGLIPPLP